MTKRTEAEADIERRMAAHASDAERVDVLDRARHFKRSWMELAEGLTRVRNQSAFTRWGFGSYDEYCARELHLRKATADKLTASFGYLADYAPHVLARDGVTEPVPDPETIQTLAKARRDEWVEPRVFESVQAEALSSEVGASSLARRFREIMSQAEPQEPGARQAESAVKLAHRLADLLAELSEVPATLASDVEEQLGRLIHYLDERVLGRSRSGREREE
jgi:hypothetical protein